MPRLWGITAQRDTARSKHINGGTPEATSAHQEDPEYPTLLHPPSPPLEQALKIYQTLPAAGMKM